MWNVFTDTLYIKRGRSVHNWEPDFTIILYPTLACTVRMSLMVVDSIGNSFQEQTPNYLSFTWILYISFSWIYKVSRWEWQSMNWLNSKIFSVGVKCLSASDIALLVEIAVIAMQQISKAPVDWLYRADALTGSGLLGIKHTDMLLQSEWHPTFCIVNIIFLLIVETDSGYN